MALLLADSLSISFIISFLLFLPFLIKWFKTDTHRLPPSPPKLPIVGNLHQLGSITHRSLRDLSEKHGPLMLLHLGPVPTIVISSANLVQEMVKSHDIAFSSRPHLKQASKLFYGCNDVAFSPYGEYWRGARKICVVELLSQKRVQLFRHVREEEVRFMMENISSYSSKKAAVNVSKILLALTNNIICRIAFGKKYGCEELTKETGILLGQVCVGDYFPWLGWIDAVTGLEARTRRLVRRLDAVMDQVIEDHLNPARKDQNIEKDFVDVLLDLMKAADVQHIPITRDNLKPIILDMFTAGTETTATALDWAMAELVSKPTIMKKAREEVRRVIGQKSKVEEEDVQKMDYVKWIIMEVLRLHPSIPLLVTRETISAIHLRGYDIPPKTRVVINAWAIARDPNYWENPEEFWPERFANKTIDFKGKDFQLIPFGVGRRICPGISFASTSMELILANLLFWFDWELPGEDKSPDMTEYPGFTVRREQDLCLLPVSKVP